MAKRWRAAPWRTVHRGVALVTVLMVVALATSVAAYLISVVHGRIDIHDLHYQRLQSRLVVQTGTEWAASVLWLDRRQTGEVDHLGEIWATPLPTVPVRVREDDPSSSIEISGAIEDAQSRLNLNNLVLASPENRTIYLTAFKKLLQSVGQNPELADAVQDWMDADDEPMNGASVESDYYLSLQPPYRAANQPQAEIGGLINVRGFNASVLSAIEPFVVFLPKETPINVNTAGSQVLSAIMPGVSQSDAQWLVDYRKEKPFQSVDDMVALFTTERRALLPKFALSVGANFYYVRATANQNEGTIRALALVERRVNGWPSVWWQRIE